MGRDDVEVVGRVFSEQRADGSGWDAWSARVSRADGALASYRPLDVDQGEILFDIAPFGDGKFIASALGVWAMAFSARLRTAWNRKSCWPRTQTGPEGPVTSTPLP